MTVGCKDIGIKKSEFVARAEFLKARTEFLKGSVREKWKGVSLYIPVHFMNRVEFQLARASCTVQIQT